MPHRKRCLRGKADFAGSTEFPANTAFVARAASAVAVVRWRQQYGRGGTSRAQYPLATPDRVPHPPHPPRFGRRDSPDHLPPLPVLAPASSNCLTRDAWCLRNVSRFLCPTSSGSPSSIAVAATAIGAALAVKMIVEYLRVRWWEDVVATASTATAAFARKLHAAFACKGSDYGSGGHGGGGCFMIAGQDLCLAATELSIGAP